MKKTPIDAETRITTLEPDELIVSTFAKLDAVALGVSLGSLLGVGIFSITNILILKGGGGGRP